MIRPVRKLSFAASGRSYKMEIDLDLDRDKAFMVNAILERESQKRVQTQISNISNDLIRVTAKGTVRPMAMRRIIEILAA